MNSKAAVGKNMNMACIQVIKIGVTQGTWRRDYEFLKMIGKEKNARCIKLKCSIEPNRIH